MYLKQVKFKRTKLLLCTEMSNMYKQVRFRPPLSSWGASVRSKHLPSRKQARWVSGKQGNTDLRISGSIKCMESCELWTQYDTVHHNTKNFWDKPLWPPRMGIVSSYTRADLVLSTHNNSIIHFFFFFIAIVAKGCTTHATVGPTLLFGLVSKPKETIN